MSTISELPSISLFLNYIKICCPIKFAKAYLIKILKQNKKFAKAIDIERKNRLLKVCYVPAISTTFLAFFLFFLLWVLAVLMKQTRQAVCAIKQSILLRCLWLKLFLTSPFKPESNIYGHEK